MSKIDGGNTMSSEGKLKQQIWQLKEETDDEAMVSGRITIAFCDLQLLLDEAKQEFSYVENYVDTEDDEDRHYKINCWFKKWFGTSP